MTMPVFSPLPKTYPWDKAHNNDIFKHKLRSKAEVESYFNGLGGAGTVVFYGTEGVDYEFDANHGFRTLTNTGRMVIYISKIISDADVLYGLIRNYSFEWQLKTSEWLEPENKVNFTPTILEMADGFSCTTDPEHGNIHNTYLWKFWTNTNNGGHQARLFDTSSGGGSHMYGANPLVLGHNNAANQDAMARPISSWEKGDYFTTRMSVMNEVHAAWHDGGLPFVSPNSAANDTGFGPLTTRPEGLKALPHSANDFYLVIGNYRVSGGSACPRWIRNIRLWGCPTDMTVHPALRTVCSFGDSFCATTFGATIGVNGFPGEWKSDWTADMEPSLKFIKEMNKSGYGVGTTAGAGQGGKNFWDTLDSEGWREEFIREYHPSMVFTFGMHNDISQVDGGVTISQLRTKLMDDYILPIMQRGCYGWGFVIPSHNDDANDVGPDRIQAHNDIAQMLRDLPADWDAAYPAYAGKVEVRDITDVMGLDWSNNPNWQLYWNGTDDIHPANPGQMLAVEQYIDMAKSFIAKMS